MLSGLFNLIGLVVSIAAGMFAFGLAREYVRQRLRFVDAVRNPLAPWAVALGAVLIAAPLFFVSVMGSAIDLTKWMSSSLMVLFLSTPSL